MQTGFRYAAVESFASNALQLVLTRVAKSHALLPILRLVLHYQRWLQQVAANASERTKTTKFMINMPLLRARLRPFVSRLRKQLRESLTVPPPATLR